jgi:hypothetical protein
MQSILYAKKSQQHQQKTQLNPESQIRHYLHNICQKLLHLSMNYIFFTLSPTDYQVKGDAPAENQE